MRKVLPAARCIQALKGSMGFVLVAMLLTGCYDFKIDSVPKWCDQISGVNLQDKYMPFWAVIFAVSTNADAIRDDFVTIMNKAHMEKVENRSPRMAWREETVFHLINLSTLLIVDPNEIIDKWRDGIEKAKTHSHKDPADACLYGTVASLFDSMKIHSIELDLFGRDKDDHVITIDTERAARATKAKMKPL